MFHKRTIMDTMCPMKIWLGTLLTLISLHGLGLKCGAQGIDASIFFPKGDFFLISEEQYQAFTAELCTWGHLKPLKAWIRREYYRLKLGAPRPSVVALRRQAAALVDVLGGEVLFEGRCVSLATRGDPRGHHIILIARIPGFGGDLFLEVWPWEEGEELFLRTTTFFPFDDQGP